MDAFSEQPAAVSPDQEAAELAIVYAKERQYQQALQYFLKVTAFTPDALSYFGLTLAMRRQRLNDAVEFCRRAIDQSPIKADFYYNLGQVHLIRNDKALAVRAFTQGLRLSPNHAALNAAVKRMGIRQRPAIEAVRRGSVINRCLGWMRHRMRKAG